MGTGHSFMAWFVAATVAVGCGGSSSNGLLGGGEKGPDAGASCATGNERCPCYGNDTCNTGLTCASGLCVKLPKSGGGSSVDGGSGASDPGRGVPDAGATGTDPGGSRGSGGARAGTGGAPSTGGRRAAGGSVGSDGGATGMGGAVSGGAPGSGGRVGAGGALASGGGSSGSGGDCVSGEKFCGGLCTPPAPRVGCGLTGCDACTLVSPANGYVTCLNGQCVTDCLSGYKKNGDKCDGTGTGGNTGNCNPSSCPSCNVVTGSPCCTTAGKCGCPMVPWVAPTCA